MSTFQTKYGPWAVVAGASEGLGEAFARELAARGLNLVLIARRATVLQALADGITKAHPNVQVRCAALDLGRPDLDSALAPFVEDLEVGLLVGNAARSVVGRFVDHPLADQLNVLDVNCRALVVLAHRFGRGMVARRRGGILVMSSIAAAQGGPFLATYAASKGFDLLFAEALWHELAPQGVDVMACRAGATLTPNYERLRPQGTPPPLMSAEAVVEEALAELGRSPSFVAGWKNRLASSLLGLLPRRAAIGIMGKTTARMYAELVK